MVNKHKKIKKGVYLDIQNQVIIKKARVKDGTILNSEKKIEQESKNYKKVNNIKLKGNITFPKLIDYNHNKKEMKIKYINGTNLKNTNNHTIFYEFGKELKKMHSQGINHNHLEIHDVIYKKPKFYLVDLDRINTQDCYQDYARVIISLATYMIKKPLKYNYFKKCMFQFKKGYSPDNNKGKEHILRQLDKNIKPYKKRKHINKLKAFVLDTIVRRNCEMINNE